MDTGAASSPPDPVDPTANEAAQQAGRNIARKHEDDAWAATGLLMSGVVVWGGAGYLVSQWLGSPLFTMAGLLLGTGTALYGIWFRYGRS